MEIIKNVRLKMHIAKSMARKDNRMHAEFPNATHSIFSISTSMANSDINVSVEIRSYADADSMNYQPVIDDGRQITQRNYSIPYSELEFQSSTNPVEELKRASLAWLIAHNSDYSGGTLVTE